MLSCQPSKPSADKGIFPQDGGSSERASNPAFADGVDNDENEQSNSSNPKSDKEYFPDTSSNQQPDTTQGIR
jgi:hypothetical protein